jgi:hypothetical protein
MSKLLLASVLVLALSAFAAGDGIIQGGKAAPAPTPTATTVAQSTEETTVVAEPIIGTVVVETATELSLGLIRSLLAIF